MRSLPTLQLPTTIAVCAFALAAVTAPAEAGSYLLLPKANTEVHVTPVTYPGGNECNDGSASCYEGKIDVEGYEDFSAAGCDLNVGAIHTSAEILVPNSPCVNHSHGGPICEPSGTFVASAYNAFCGWKSDGTTYYLRHFHRSLANATALRVQVSTPGQQAQIWGELWPWGILFQFMDPACVGDKPKTCASNTLPCCEDIFSGSPGSPSCLTATTVMTVDTN